MARAPDFPQLSETHLEIMNLVWRAGEATVGEVWKALTARRKVARNTVLTLMERLEKKGWLKRRVDGHAYRYSAAVGREATLGRIVGRLVDTAFDGSAEGLMMALLDQRGVTSAEAKRIRAMIDKSRRAKS
ncbi:MAG: BlaI/MecI/CopY family transcriptional regulator [Planctomycetia bacterium]|nr:BlaI/MecI/CopY family transcriptional regulator [Planctomycetia bacterium]